MMPQTLGEWLVALGLLISIGGNIFSWFTFGGKRAEAGLTLYKEQAGERFTTIEAEVGDLGHRMQTVEGEFRHLPSKKDVHDLNILVERMIGTQGRQEEKLEAVDRSIRRVEDFLIERGKAN